MPREGQADGPAERGLCARDGRPPPKVLLTLLPGHGGRPRRSWGAEGWHCTQVPAWNWVSREKSPGCVPGGRTPQQVDVCQAWPRAGGAGAVDLDLGVGQQVQQQQDMRSCRLSPAEAYFGPR